MRSIALWESQDLKPLEASPTKKNMKKLLKSQIPLTENDISGEAAAWDRHQEGTPPAQRPHERLPVVRSEGSLFGTHNPESWDAADAILLKGRLLLFEHLKRKVPTVHQRHQGGSSTHAYTDSLRNNHSVNHSSLSSPDEFSSPTHQVLKSSAASHSNQPTLFPFEPPSNQCTSQKMGNMRNTSFSQATKSSLFMRSDTAAQKLAQGYRHYVNVASGHIPGLYGLPKPSRLNSDLTDSAHNLLRGFGSDTPTKSSRTGLESENEDIHGYKTPNNALCKEFSQLSTDSHHFPATPHSVYQIPRTFNPLALASNDLFSTPPPRTPKPGQSESRWGNPQQPHNGDNVGIVSVTIPRRNTLPVMKNRHHQASSCEVYYNYPQFGDVSTEQVVESKKDGLSSHLQTKSSIGCSESTESEDNYVPMNPGSSFQFNAENCNDNAEDAYIPMSPVPHYFNLPGIFSAALPSCKDSAASLCLRPTRVSEIQPPSVNRNLKPDRRTKPTPLDLRGTAVIEELPFKSSFTKSWSRPTHTLKSSSSQYCRPVSSQSNTSTNSWDGEEHDVAMQTKSSIGRSESTESEDNYVPMNPGSSFQFNAENCNDNTEDAYIPMSPVPHYFNLPGIFSAALPSCKDSAASLCPRPTQVSEIQPPSVNRNLKPDRRTKPTPLDLRGTAVIEELPFKSSITKSWCRPTHTLKSSSSQYCRPVSSRSTTSTNSWDSEENDVAMQTPVSASPGTSSTKSPAQKKSSGSVDYLVLDFQPVSPSPHRKPSTSSVTSNEKVEYVQVDKVKTQALQKTKQEWDDMRQFSDSAKSDKQ
ncbi:GRB2-associated-binding protein 2-like [Ascaphus truei]|uniref:GRB2-associated-binding protein 2-like n=1 Tax=Ascaphus truei TaxID=8439 RepID=UPI003F5A433E